MTSEQCEVILNELREIRKLLTKPANVEAEITGFKHGFNAVSDESGINSKPKRKRA